MGLEEVVIRSYGGESDRAGVENLERQCEVGPAERVYLFTDTMGDPICRIRNSPMHKMLVAELGNQLVGAIQGSVKLVTLHNKPAVAPPKGRGHNLARVGYILGLRIAPVHRRKGIGSKLVCRLEEWFASNDVDYSYMATEKDNEASITLFVQKFGYLKFRTPAILVNPVRCRPCHVSSNVEIAKLKVEEAEFLYRNCMADSTEFFPCDIDKVLGNKLSLGTWVAYPRGEFCNFTLTSGQPLVLPKSWAMISVWNSGEVFKLRLGKAPLSCLLYAKSWSLMDRFLPCFNLLPSMPDFFNPFGFYFMYGVYHDGPSSCKLVRNLCKFVHNMASSAKKKCGCKVVVTEVGGCDSVLSHHIPHWKLLSCSEDLWCIKAIKKRVEAADTNSLLEWTRTQQTNKPLFVDPREV